MDGLYNLYLAGILLMRSGDIETNPGPNTPEGTVSEEEYLELSERIDPSNYKRVGIRLGIPYTVLSGIKKQSDDYSDHFMNVFMKWRDKQPQGTNTRALLAEELQTCHLDELSDLLHDGSLVKSRTDKTSAVPITSQPHQPLSPELVQRCSEDFKFKYRTTLCKIRADPLNPDSLMQFEDMYTNLVLEEEHGRNKQKLECSDLLNLRDNGKFPRRLLVQGEAGAGKTTLCAKIAWDWISGKHLQDILWLIIVPLRDAQKYTIGEIAKSYLTSNNPATASQLTEYMHLNQDKVFILFDGLDEFSGDVQDKEDGPQSRGEESHSHQSAKATGQSSQAEDHSSHAKGQSLHEIEIREILRSEKLETCPVIVTTRPWKAREIRWNDSLRELYTFLHVEGFSKQYVAEYIRKNFAGEEAKAETLIQFANDNDVISENMASYPIYITMLCLMWREFDEEKREMMKSLQTFSQIFKEMFVFLKEHYALKLSKESCSVDEPLNDRLKEIKTLLDPIAKLALNGLLNKTLVFKEDDFEHCPGSMETACRVGVLSEENRIIPRKGRHNVSNLRKQSTVFFPHKLFQEFMAGMHLASLYETDKAEYTRLIEKVTGQRKEEFRYLLYFTASQNQTVGINVLTHIKSSMQRGGDSHFLVDVAFECHDTDTASLVKNNVSLPNSTLTISRGMTAHTLAGYAFIQPDMVKLNVDKECGPTMSRDVAEMICFIPSLKEVSLQTNLHIDFFTTLELQGQFSQVKSLRISVDAIPVSAQASHDFVLPLHSMPNLTELTVLGDILSDEFCCRLKARASSLKLESLQFSGRVVPVSASASRDLVEALCSMPNLTKLTVPGMTLSDEFCSTLKSRASSMKVKSLKILGDVVRVSAQALHHFAEALCSTPNLTELTMSCRILSDEFCSTMEEKASSMEVKSLKILGDVVPVSAPALHDFAAALCSMPNLIELTVPCRILSDEFCSTLKARASSMKVKSLKVSEAVVPVSAPSSHDLAVALCSMPNLTELMMHCRILSDKFCSTFKERALSMKLKSIQITGHKVPVSAPALHEFAVALCSVPNLTELTMPDEILSDKFCSTLKAMASSMEVKSLEISGDTVDVSAPVSYDLAEALCSMPHLTELTVPCRILSDEFCSTLEERALSMELKFLKISEDVVHVSAPASQDLAVALCSLPNLSKLTVPCRILSNEFCSTLKARASSMKDCFPQISKGNFTFNGTPHANLESFISRLLSSPHQRRLDTRVSFMRGSHSIPSVSPLVPSSVSYDHPSTSRDLGDVHQTYHEEHGSMSRDSGYCTYHPSGLDTSVSVMRGSYGIPSVSPLVQSSMPYDQPSTCRDLSDVQHTYEEHGSISRDSGYYTSHPRGLDTSVSVIRGSHGIPSVSPLVQSSMPYDQRSISRNLGDVHQIYHVEHGSMSRHSGYSTSHPRWLDTSVSVMRGSHGIPSVSPLVNSSMPYDPPSTSRDLGDVHQTYHVDHGSMSRPSVCSTSLPRGLDTSVSVMRGSHGIPSISPLVQSTMPYDQPSTSRDLDGVYQTYHEEHGSMSMHSGYSIPHPMFSFDSHSEPPSSLPHQADRTNSTVLQLLPTVRSRSGRSQSVKRTAPCTQSRVPKDVPNKHPRVDTPE